MYTRRQIAELAADEGYGEAGALENKFKEYSRYGLIGPSIGKESRRGGAGLYHPVQAELFLSYLEHRTRGINLYTLANLPIGFWLLGFDGIPVQQVQRALFFGLAPLLPTSLFDSAPNQTVQRRSRTARRPGDRSFYRDNLSNQLAVLRATDDFTSLVSLLQTDVLEGISRDWTLPVSKPEFVGAACRSFPSPHAPLFGNVLYELYLSRITALVFVDALVRDTPATRSLFEWARASFISGLVLTEFARPAFNVDCRDTLAWLFEPPTVEQIVRNGGITLLTELGMGIRALAGDKTPIVQKFGAPDVTLDRLKIDRRDVLRVLETAPTVR